MALPKTNTFKSLLSVITILMVFCSVGWSNLNLPTHTTVITREELRGSRYFSVGDALEGILSMNVEHSAFQGSEKLLKVRGVSSSKHVQVLIDGRPTSFGFDYEIDLTQFPLAMVERIEITRGGQSVSYGAQAIGGTINIVTGHPTENGLDAEAGTSVGRDGTKASQGRAHGRSFWGDLSYFGAKEESAGFQFNNNYDGATHMGKMTRSFNGKGYWGGEYFHQESHNGVPYGTPIPFEEWDGGVERLPSSLTVDRTQESQFARAHLVSPEIKNTIVELSYTYAKRNFELRDGRPGFAIFRDQDFESNTFKGSIKNNGFELGGERNGLTRSVFPLQENRSQQNALYVLKKWESDRWTFLPSYRYDHISNIGGISNPRGVLIYRPHSKLTLSGSATKAFRAPTFDELFVSTDNSHSANLNEESAQNYDLGFLWRLSSGTHLGFTGYYSRVDDLILVKPTQNQLQNFGFEENMGVEGELGWHIGSQNNFFNFKFNTNWTYQRSRRSQNNGLGLVPTAMTPRHLLFFQLKHHLPRGVTFVYEARKQTEQYQYDNNTGIRVPGYTTYNLRMRARTLRAHLFFEIENVFEERFADTIASFVPKGGQLTHSLVPQPDRTYWVGVSMRFKN